MKKHWSVKLSGGVMAAVLIISSLGCAMMSGSKKKEAAAPYMGEVTVLNQSGAALCGVELRTRKADAYLMRNEQLEVDASYKAELLGELSGLTVADCKGNIVYQGSPKLLHNKLILSPAGTKAPEGADHTAVALAAKPTSFQAHLDRLRAYARQRGTPIVDEKASAGILKAAQANARAKDWSHNAEVILIASDRWFVANDKMSRQIAVAIGQRFTDNHCNIQIHTFGQAGDGEKFDGPFTHKGVSHNISAPCLMLAWMKTQKGAASE